MLSIGKPFTYFLTFSAAQTGRGGSSVGTRERRARERGKEEGWVTQRLCLLFEAKSPQLLSTDLGISHPFPLMKIDTSTCGLLASLFHPLPRWTQPQSLGSVTKLCLASGRSCVTLWPWTFQELHEDFGKMMTSGSSWFLLFFSYFKGTFSLIPKV